MDGTSAVPDTPKHWGKAHQTCFHGTQGQVGCPSGVIVRGINKLICFFQAPLCKSQATGLKPGCVHSVMDMHSNGIIWRGQSLTGGASTPGASHTQQHFAVIKGSNHAYLTVECSTHQPTP